MLTHGFVCEDLASKQLSLQNMHISFFPKELTCDYRSQEVPTSAVSKLEARRGTRGSGLDAKVGKDQCPSSRESGGVPPVQSFVVGRSSAGWMGHTHMKEGHLLHSIISRNTPTDTSITWEQIPARSPRLTPGQLSEDFSIPWHK